MLTEKQVYAKYGTPNESGTGYLVTFNLPYPMRLAWDLKTKVTKIRCHNLIKDKLLNVFNDLQKTYGYDKLVQLEIDVFGGCFEYRKKRGGDSLSMHSWGIAIDLNPTKNALNSTKLNAQFAKPEYKPMIAIFYKHGFISLGVEKNFDWTHFEINV
jgi:hypothetical protein